jgi:sulfite exporter TauE/SafE
MNNIWLAFITGLTTGGISCFAVQGGLLASALTEENKKISTLIFLGAKLFAYTLLGFLLGFLGSSLHISPKVQGVFQILIGLFMLATAARMLNLHPIFRYFAITPPKFVLRLMRNQAQAKSFFTPAILGLMTILIPCGVTQAMMLYAIGTSNPFWGAGILFAFVLGTSPVFFAIGIASSELFKKKAFNYIAATFIFVIGIISINSGQVLRGSVHTLQNYYAVMFNTNAISKAGNVVNIDITNRGYKADVNTIKVGVPVKLVLKTNNVTSCARAFTVPDLNYFKILPATGTETIEFTPTHTGLLTYTCSMGMYSGSLNVVD